MVKKKRNSLSISYKKCIAQEKQKSVGNPNGGTQLSLQIFLAPEQVLAYFSTTIFISKFWNTSLIPRDDL